MRTPSERQTTAWHEAGHGLIWAALGVSCSLRLFSDEVGQALPLDLEAPINSGILLLNPLGGVLGELLMRAHTGAANLDDKSLLEAWRELNSRGDLGDDRRSLIREIKNVYFEQTQETTGQVFGLLQIFCKSVAFTAWGRNCVKEIASELEVHEEVHLVCAETQFTLKVVPPTTLLVDELELTYDQTEGFLERIESRVNSPLRWGGKES